MCIFNARYIPILHYCGVIVNMKNEEICLKPHFNAKYHGFVQFRELNVI